MPAHLHGHHAFLVRKVKVLHVVILPPRLHRILQVAQQLVRRSMERRARLSLGRGAQPCA